MIEAADATLDRGSATCQLKIATNQTEKRYTYSKRLTFSYLAANSRTSSVVVEPASTFSNSTEYLSTIDVYPPLH